MPQEIIHEAMQVVGVSTSAYKALRDKRNHIKAKMTQTVLAYTALHQLEDSLKKADSSLKGAAKNAMAYANYTKMVDQVVWEMQQTPHINTLCTEHFKKVCRLGFVSPLTGSRCLVYWFTNSCEPAC